MGRQRERCSRRNPRGFTLVEIMVAIVIIAIVLGIAIMVGQEVRTNAELKNTKGTIEVLVTALREYERLQGANTVAWPPEPYYFADPTCPEHTGVDNPSHLDNFGACWTKRGYVPNPTLGDHGTPSLKWKDIVYPETFLAARASIEVLYWYLSQEPDCEAILSRLADEMVTNEDNDAVTVGGETTALLEVNDAWGRPIRYRTRGEGNFPVLTSAGVDGVFDNADDIVSN